MQLTVAVHSLEHAAQLAAFEQLAHQVDGFMVIAPRGFGRDRPRRRVATSRPC